MNQIPIHYPYGANGIRPKWHSPQMAFAPNGIRPNSDIDTKAIALRLTCRKIGGACFGKSAIALRLTCRKIGGACFGKSAIALRLTCRKIGGACFGKSAIAFCLTCRKIGGVWFGTSAIALPGKRNRVSAIISASPPKSLLRNPVSGISRYLLVARLKKQRG